MKDKAIDKLNSEVKNPLWITIALLVVIGLIGYFGLKWIGV